MIFGSVSAGKIREDRASANFTALTQMASNPRSARAIVLASGVERARVKADSRRQSIAGTGQCFPLTTAGPAAAASSAHRCP
jgi:hypothetical protein